MADVQELVEQLHLHADLSPDATGESAELAKEAATTITDLTTRLAAAEAREARLRHVIDRDRYIVAAGIGSIEQVLRSRSWLIEGRGPYEWDDERYQQEFSAAYDDIGASLEPLRKVAWDKSDCENIEARVVAAKQAAKEMLAMPIRAREMIAADLGLPCPACTALTETSHEG